MTEYAYVKQLEESLYRYGTYESSRWTRSISRAKDGKGVVTVEYDGNVRSVGCVPYCGYEGVRPVISINISGNTVPEAQNMIIFGYDSNHDLDNEPNIYYSGTSGQKCGICNNDLEAWLSVHDSFTVGVCISCGGTGKK